MRDAETAVEEIKARVAAFVAARDWEKFHQPKNLAMSIAIEAAELMEHYQWDKGEDVNLAEVAEELADILIYCVSFANACGIDMAAAIAAKLDKNEGRFPALRDGLA